MINITTGKYWLYYFANTILVPYQKTMNLKRILCLFFTSLLEVFIGFVEPIFYSRMNASCLVPLQMMVARLY